MKTIFIDLDDTVADFRGSAEKLLGRTLEPSCPNLTPADWNIINSDVGFYRNLKVCDGAVEMVDLAKSIEGHRVLFLGAISPHVSNTRKVIDDKFAWSYEHFQVDSIFVGKSINKSRYAFGNLLIDDKKYVIDDWMFNGGVGIRHINCEETKNILEQYRNSLTYYKT